MHDGGALDFDLGTGLSTGRLAGFSAEGWPLVEAADGATGEARSLVPLGPAELGRELALARIGGEGLVVLGLIQPPARTVAADDEDRRVVEAREQLELRCGPASLTLFADGRVEIRGTQILSRSEGANRVQGASVHLN